LDLIEALACRRDDTCASDLSPVGIEPTGLNSLMREEILADAIPSR